MASSSKQGLNSETFDAYNDSLQLAALKAVKTSVGAVPPDVAFHRTVHPDFARDLDECSERVLALTNKLLALAWTSDASVGARGKGKKRLESQDDVVDNFQSLVVDAMDQLLERAVSLSSYTNRMRLSKL
jgi:exosome complex exonuclease RRP6